ncbi:phosphopantothenoylcysteine decarboxylase/phosphopantothenate--cysteine ligase [Luteimonas sp. RC10]|nr:phosphopantothenoylcysteine decarboxylase/phosphopantothenate--cysteine ligase [Luteimonas sp. RC10]
MSGPLAGRRVIVSAGPTYEDLDPVRFLGNRSSGKMGFAVAAAAAQAGADVQLVAGPVHLPTPDGVTRVDVRSAAQMHAAVFAALPADIYVGAAAVADFTPARVATSKIKKRVGEAGLTLELVRTRDILAELAADPRRPRLMVGFAAETDDVDDNARHKLAAKRVDLIAANRVGVAGSGFEGDDNLLVVHDAAGQHSLGPGPKTAVAADLVALIAHRLDPEPP